MKTKEISGLRCPDDYMIRMFFKLGLHMNTGSFIEFGCGNGNNL